MNDLEKRKMCFGLGAGKQALWNRRQGFGGGKLCTVGLVRLISRSMNR